MTRSTHNLQVPHHDGESWQWFYSEEGQPQTSSLGNWPIDHVQADAAELANTVRGKGYHKQPITLMIPSSWCLSAVVDKAGLSRRDRPNGLRYRFEEHVPLAAEELTTDFIESKNTALGVAVESQRVSTLLDAMESQGLVIDAVIPESWPRLAQALSNIPAAPASTHLLVVQHNGQMDLLWTRCQQPVAWLHEPTSAESLRLHLDRTRIAHHETPKVLAWVEDMELRSVISAATQSNPATFLNPGTNTEALATASPVNLRRDALAPDDPYRAIRGALRFAGLGLAAALTALTLIGLTHIQTFNTQAQSQRDQQATVFREVFPGQRVPIGIQSRLQSEWSRLQGVHGNPSESAVRPAQRALPIMAALLERLPNDLRYRVNETRIEDKRLILQGEARSIQDADQIAAALRLHRGFHVDAPRTERLTEVEGVRFTITAEPVEASP